MFIKAKIKRLFILIFICILQIKEEQKKKEKKGKSCKTEFGSEEEKTIDVVNFSECYRPPRPHQFQHIQCFHKFPEILNILVFINFTKNC